MKLKVKLLRLIMLAVSKSSNIFLGLSKFGGNIFPSTSICYLADLGAGPSTRGPECLSWNLALFSLCTNINKLSLQPSYPELEPISSFLRGSLDSWAPMGIYISGNFPPWLSRCTRSVRLKPYCA